MPVLQKISLVDQVYQALRADILSLRIPLGAKLNIQELEQDFWVSRTPIREALIRLQQGGLIRYRNNVGARVLSLEAYDVRDIQYLALTLHCAAIRLAMKNGDHEGMARNIALWTGRYRSAADPGSEVRAFHEVMGTFYHNCGNRRLDASMIAIQSLQLLLRNISALDRTAREDTLADFERMRQGVLDGDVELLCRTVRENAKRAEPFLNAYVREHGGD